MVLNVNGAMHEVAVDPDVALLTVLRDYLNLTGSKYGCGEGACGACTVLINGNPTRSCITAAGAATNKEIITIEGLEKNGKFHPVQEAFLSTDAFQCSYCTPGFILSTKALLEENPSPTVEQIRHYLAGNLCRCGSYYKIQDAVLDAATRLRAAGANPARTTS